MTRLRLRLFSASLLLSVITCWASPTARAGDPFILDLENGQRLFVSVVESGIFHVRLSPPGSRAVAPSLLERYGIVRLALPHIDFTPTQLPGRVVIRTATAELTIARSDGRIALRLADGRELLTELTPLVANAAAGSTLAQRKAALAAQFRLNNDSPVLGDPGHGRTLAETFATPNGAGFGFTAKLRENERFYGLGTPSKKHLELRGRAYHNWVIYKENEQPVPFVMSTGGWAVFVNTSWRHYIDIGDFVNDELFLWGPEGPLDFFLIAGPSLPSMLDRYTQIAGRPMLLPMWAYGLTWINHDDGGQAEVLDNARLFRHTGVPCDGFGLEPGWMKQRYDFSQAKDWNTSRFYMKPFLRGEQRRNQTFIGALERTGFKLHLWLCCDADLTPEEERIVAVREGRSPLATPEPWFDHLKRFIDDGVVGWKLDPARLVDRPNPQRTYFNGRGEFEMHNLSPVLWAKQICEGQRAYTGRRPMLQYCGGWAGSQRWTAQTVGDTLLVPDGLTWILSTAMSGYMNTGGDMVIFEPKYKTLSEPWIEGSGIHAGFLSPWTLIDGWASMYQPWWAGRKFEQMIREYAQLRYRLLPYIYSAAHVGARTGMPIARPMPLAFPDDPALADNIREYMLGDSLLVAAFTRTVRFPAGRWIDYWTRKEYVGPADVAYDIPEGRGGGLFVKAGAILPLWPLMDYVGQKPVTSLDLHVFPDGDSQFTLYEDDGLSLGYEKGEVAVTKILCRVEGGSGVLTIEPRTGKFTGMPERRRYEIWLHGPECARVSLGTKVPREIDHYYDTAARATRMIVEEDRHRQEPILVGFTRK